MKKFLLASVITIFTILVGCGSTSTSNDEVVSTENTTIIETTTYEIPNLKGMNIDEAKKLLSEHGITIKSIEKYDDEFPKDSIITYYRKSETEVTVSLSKGSGVSVPDFSNHTIDECKALLENVGLNYEIEYNYDDLSMYHIINPEDTIINKSGFRVDEGSTVKISVIKPPIKLSDVSTIINSAGGCEVAFSCENLSDKQIAYITFDIYFYDNMGNPAYCSILNECHRPVKLTGPLNPQNSAYTDLGPVIYNPTVGAVLPKKIEIEYTDGTVQKITNNAYWSFGNYYGGKLNG